MHFVEGFGTPLWWIFPIIMVFFCFFMMRGYMGGMHVSGGGKGESALETLDKRYAGGEIDKEEYEQMKRVLNYSNNQDRPE